MKEYDYRQEILELLVKKMRLECESESSRNEARGILDAGAIIPRLSITCASVWCQV